MHAGQASMIYQHWAKDTSMLTGFLKQREANDAVRDANHISVRVDPEFGVVSLMWPQITKRNSRGELVQGQTAVDDPVYRVLEVVFDGSDEYRATIVDSCTAVRCPEYSEFGTVSSLKLPTLLDRLYDLHRTIIPYQV